MLCSSEMMPSSLHEQSADTLCCNDYSEQLQEQQLFDMFLLLGLDSSWSQDVGHSIL